MSTSCGAHRPGPGGGKAELESYVTRALETHLGEVRSALGDVGHGEYCAMNDFWISSMRRGGIVVTETQ